MDIIETDRIKISEDRGYIQAMHIQLQYIVKGAQFKDRGHLETI